MLKYELYWYPFIYEDKPNIYEYRPAVILDDDLLLVTKITGNISRNNKYEYTIIDWKQAGLSKPSNIRLNKVAIINGNLGKYIGKLSNKDILNLQKLGY